MLFHRSGYKYLGVEIDQSLTWRDHVGKIAKKASGEIVVLRRVRRLISYHTLITTLKSIVQPYFDYCSIVWGGDVGKGCATDSRPSKTELPGW